MKHTFTLDAWYRHIKKQLRKQPALSLAEIKQPLRFNHTLWGRIREAKQIND
jgi:hypothetical protein